MLLVSLFYISNMDRRFSKVASFQKWLHFVIYIYFIVFIYMSKSYLIATMIPIIAFMIYKRVLNILALLSLSLILIVGGILWTSNGIVKRIILFHTIMMTLSMTQIIPLSHARKDCTILLLI